MSTHKVLNVCFGATNPNQPDKKFYSQHGILVFGSNDKGEERISLKLSSIPIDADFNGWFSIFPPKDKNGKGNDHTQADINDIEF